MPFMFGIKKLFGTRDETDPKKRFWDWFIRNKYRFAKMNGTDDAHDFLNELIEQMNPYNQWLKALAGPYEDGRFELIITADGDIALFCKVEELVNAAPSMEDWLITAHKPPIGAD